MDGIFDYDFVDVSILDDEVALASGDEWYVNDPSSHIKAEKNTDASGNTSSILSSANYSSNVDENVMCCPSNSKKRRRRSTNTRPPNPSADMIRLATEESLKELNVDPNSTEGKMRKKQIRNRMSAQLHRENKKAYIGTLEKQLKDRDYSVSSLQSRISSLIDENRRLRQQLGLPAVDLDSIFPADPVTACAAVTPVDLTNVPQGVNMNMCGMQGVCSTDSAHTTPLNSSDEDGDGDIENPVHHPNTLAVANGMLHSQMTFNNQGSGLLTHVKDGQFIYPFQLPNVQDSSGSQLEQSKYQQQYLSVSPSPMYFSNSRGLALFSAAVVFLFGFSLLSPDSLSADRLSTLLPLPESTVTAYVTPNELMTGYSATDLSEADLGHILASSEIGTDEMSSDSSSYRLLTTSENSNSNGGDDIDLENSADPIEDIHKKNEDNFVLVSYVASPSAPVEAGHYHMNHPPGKVDTTAFDADTSLMHELAVDEQFHGLWRYNSSNSVQLYPCLGKASGVQTGSFSAAVGNVSHTDHPSASASAMVVSEHDLSIHPQATPKTNLRQSPPSTGVGGGMQKRYIVSPTAQDAHPSSDASAASVYVSRVLLSEGKALLHPTLLLSTPLPFAYNQTVQEATGAREGYGAAGFAKRDRKLGKAVVVAPQAIPHTSEGVPDTDSSTTHMVTMLIPVANVQWGTSWSDNSLFSTGNKSSDSHMNRLSELFRRHLDETVVTSTRSTDTTHDTYDDTADPMWVEISCQVVKAQLIKNVTE